MKNDKRSIKVLSALTVVNLIACVGIIIFLTIGIDLERREASGSESNTITEFGTQMNTDVKYIIYIGTNDKDTYKKIIPTDKARETVNAICAKYTDGYTEIDALGGWVDESNILTQENTLVYSFYGISEEQLRKIMDEVISELDQSTILVEKQQAVYTYYSGE